jgi:hypothetical protein
MSGSGKVLSLPETSFSPHQLNLMRKIASLLCDDACPDFLARRPAWVVPYTNCIVREATLVPGSPHCNCLEEQRLTTDALPFDCISAHHYGPSALQFQPRGWQG